MRKMRRKLYRRHRALLIAAAVYASGSFGYLPRASAYQDFVDLNTYLRSREDPILASGFYSAGTNSVSATQAFGGADGAWLIEQNSGGISTTQGTNFTLTDWRSMITNIGGSDSLLSTEDNPPGTTSSNGVYTVNNQNSSFTSTLSIAGLSSSAAYSSTTGNYGTGTTGFTYVDAMSYNETGSLTGGTLLSPAQINGTSGNGTSSNPYNVGEAATHGGAISVLTRGYNTDSNNNGITFQGATNTDLALSNVPAVVIETISFDGENTLGLVKAAFADNKRSYIYLQADYEDSRVIPALYDLKQQAAAATASGLVNIILNNDYNTTNSANAYGWYGVDGTVQDANAFLVAFKNVVPVTTYVWNSTGSGTISSTSNWSPQYQFPYFENKAAVAADTTFTSYPSHTYDAISFSNGTLTGNITATIDTTSAEALGVYFAGAANYTLASSTPSSNALTLTSYGTLGASGDVGYGVNVIPIQIAGTGSNLISAPVTLTNTTAIGLTIDQQNTTNPFTMSGTLTTEGLPITVQGAGTTILSGAISGSTAIVKTGAGVLSLGGAFTNSGVTASVSTGTLQLNSTGTGVAAAAITDIAAGSAVKVIGNSSSQLGQNYSGADLTINGGGTFDLNGKAISLTALAGTNGYVTSTVAGSSTLTVGVNGQPGAFGGVIQDGAGTLSLIKTGAGAQTLSGTNTYSGTTTINGDEIDFTSAGSLPSGSGLLTVASGATAELDAPNNSNITLAMPIALSGVGASGDRGALFLNNGKISTYTLTGGITLSGATTVGAYGVSQNLNFNSVITGSGSLTFNDEGGAVNSHSFNVAFNAANSYTGTTVLESGNANLATFKISVTNALPVATVVTLNANAGNLTLNLNGQSQTIGGLVSAGTVAHDFVSSTGGQLTINNAAAYAYAGQINGTAALIKSGIATQTLGGSNGYTGSTTINAGTLLLTGSLANTATLVNTGGTLAGTGSVAGAVTVAGTIAPGTAAGVSGTFPLNGGLTLNTGASLALDLGTSNGSDKVSTTSLLLNPSLQCLVATGSSFTTGNYAIIDYSGTLTDNSKNFSGWTVTGLPATAQYHFALSTDDAAGGTGPAEPDVVLDVTVVPEPVSMGRDVVCRRADVPQAASGSFSSRNLTGSGPATACRRLCSAWRERKFHPLGGGKSEGVSMRVVGIFCGAVLFCVAPVRLAADTPTSNPTTTLTTEPSTNPTTNATTTPATQPIIILPGVQPAGHVPLALPIGAPATQSTGMVDGILRFPLDDNWQFYSEHEHRWYPATVPGDVHLDLLRNGLIADPFYGVNEKTLQWISQVPWTYRCTFDVDPKLLDQPSVKLVADGIDTEASITLNGRSIGNVANMFLRYRFDVKAMLKNRGNTLEIHFPVGSPRETLRKESVEYGWDFSPHFVTSGIYRPIRLEAGPSKQLDFVGVQQVHEAGKVTLKLSADQPIISRLIYDGKEVATGVNELTVTDPKLWWPNGMGEHPLYDLYVEPKDGNGTGWHRRIGLRTVQLSTPDEPNHAQAFTFIVNGKAVFAKGASVVPPHAFAGAETPQLERDLVDSAADANMNMLRIWSGGVFLLDDFYDRCDERGIMLWQEEQFLIYKDSPAYRAALAPDCTYQAQRLQSHPSIAMWCGNNEGELVHRLNITVRPKQFDLERAKGLVFITRRLMPDALHEVDPTVSWLPSSPHSPWDMLLPFDDKLAGDLHEWAVWHGNASPHEYELNRRPRFASEYGMESLSSLGLMKQFCPPEDLDMALHSPTLGMRQKAGGIEGNNRFATYLDRSFRKPKDFASLVYLTQLNQSQSDSIGTRWWRRLMPHCMGALIWQLNDTWPGTTWSILDFGGSWKPAMYQAKRDFAPALVSAFIPPEAVGKNLSWKDDHRPVRIDTVYDGLTEQPATLRWSLCNVADGSVIRSGTKNLTLHPNEAATQAVLDFTEDCRAAGDAKIFLRYAIESSGKTVGEDTFWFTEMKNVDLPKAKLTQTVKKLSEDEFELDLVSDSFAYRVWLDVPAIRCDWSENSFDLFPNEHKTIRFHVREAVPEDRIGGKIESSSLSDTY